MKYLDPRNDITFRKIFGGHKNLCISLLNSLLPLPEDELIESIEYLAPDMLPDSPDYKNSIVDVRCTDSKGRVFLVEMQMFWVNDYFNRFLLNACKGFAHSARKGNDYGDIPKVYSLCILNSILLKDTRVEDIYAHSFAMRHDQYPDIAFDGLTMVFIELPKYAESKTIDKRHSKMARLWLEFLSIQDDTDRKEISKELIDNDITNQALDILEESSFTDAERYAYEQRLDSIRSSRSLFSGARKDGHAEGRAEGHAEGLEEGIVKGHAKGLKEGLAKGRAEGRAEGLEEGIAKGHTEGLMNAARKMIASGMSADSVAQILGVAPESLKHL